MAKFIKSIFNPPTEKRKNVKHEEEEGDGEGPVSPTRKLSMSRSGRLKQAYRKRHALSMEMYGSDSNIQPVEKPKSMEYHVHAPAIKNAHPQAESRRKSDDSATLRKNVCKSPEEEIDSAFEIIDKSELVVTK